MTAPGTRRAIYDQKLGTDKCDNSTMSLQMGFSQGANQSGQNFGLGRQIYDAKYCPKSGEVAEDQYGAGSSRNYIPDYQDEGYQGYHEEEQVYQEDGTDYQEREREIMWRWYLSKESLNRDMRFIYTHGMLHFLKCF